MSDLLALARERQLDRLELVVPGGAGLDEFFARFGFDEWGRKPGWIAAGAADFRDEITLGALL
jgi:hypothetical protein